MYVVLLIKNEKGSLYQDHCLPGFVSQQMRLQPVLLQLSPEQIVPGDAALLGSQSKMKTNIIFMLTLHYISQIWNQRILGCRLYELNCPIL